MRNFEKNIEETPEQELYKWVNEYDFRIVHLASDELTRRSLEKTRDTMTAFNEVSSKQSEIMISLTKWIMGLTIIMTLGLIIQIFLAIYK